MTPARAGTTGDLAGHRRGLEDDPRSRGDDRVTTHESLYAVG